MRPATVADTLLPGSGLVVDGRLAPGAALLVPAVLLLCALLLSLTFGAFAAWVVPRALPAYVLLSVIALALRWRYTRRERGDPARARVLARAAAKAWLRGESQAADEARQLVRACPEMANAWRLLAMVTGDARATARAEAIERRQA
jgi:hypothetical protein